MGMGREEDEFELNLELSIGRAYQITENSNMKICQQNVHANCGISRSNFYRVTENNACESMDLHRRKKIKALRRQEAPRKMKRADCSNNGVGDDLGLSLFTSLKVGTQGLYPKVQLCNGNSTDLERSNGIHDRRNENRSPEQCPSAVSDYQTMSYKGGSSSDSGSHSTHPTTLNHLENHDSSLQAETGRVVAGPNLSSLMSNPQPEPDRSRDQTNNASSTSAGLNEKPLNINAAASVPRMPYVSATGNGPNGRTIMGFLYKYTKMEVSIVCVCHRRSFSPAEFVEHAGGVDILHPLKHITIVPTTAFVGC